MNFQIQVVMHIPKIHLSYWILLEPENIKGQHSVSASELYVLAGAAVLVSRTAQYLVTHV